MSALTAQALIDALIEHDVLDELRLASLLGEERHGVTLNKLELALTKNAVLSQARLLALKGAVAGLPVLDDPGVGVKPLLPPELARKAGALVLDLPTPSVAMVEPLAMYTERVAEAIGIPQFAIYLVTASQFSELYQQTYASGAKVEKVAGFNDLYEIFDEVVRRRATDVHLAIGTPPALRVDGELAKLPRQPVDEQWLTAELRRLVPDRNWEEFLVRKQTDFAYSYGSSRFRINVYLERGGPAMAARRLSGSLPTADQLNLPGSIRKLGELERGLVLVTGPTGSGKSTTLAALLGDMNRNQARHILTLEDPIEYHLPTDQRSTVHQRELGVHFDSFPDALRAALRQDPDVILVGEMRDAETIKVALTAAETGHLVFGTLHTYDAASTVGRIVSSFNPDEQDEVRASLAYILKGVVSQTLLPLAAGQGRVAAFEIMLGTPAVQNNLKKHDGMNSIRNTLETGSREGMQNMDMSLASLARRNLVREAEAEFRCRNIEDFRRYLKQTEF